MRTDTIFYKLFQTFNSLLFELLNQPVEEGYQFISVEVKEKAFRFDRIYFPAKLNQLIYFVEVQFQRKPNFYTEFLCEILLYLSQYQPQNDWKAIAIFSDRSIEPLTLTKFQQELLANNRIVPIYLDQLNNSQSIAIQIIQLITSPNQTAIQLVQTLKQQNLSPDIIELIETVLVYKFTNLTRQEVESMFALSDLKKTKIYQEALQEGEEKGRQEGEEKGKQEGRQEGKQEIALNLLRVGMDIIQVAKVTGLSTEQIQLLQK